MSAAVAKLFVEVGGDTSQAVGQLRTFDNSLSRIGVSAIATGAGLTAGLSVPLAAVGGVAIGAAMDFESSFAGVRKTVDGSAASVAEFAASTGHNVGTAAEMFGVLEQQMRDMSMVKPVNVNELNAIGEAAGALGIKSKDIDAFTNVVSDLKATTDLTAESGSNFIARFANITGMAKEAAPPWDRLGSAIVHLGNNTAATEQDIMKMGVRIAGAGTTVGLTEPQILSMAAALSSVGVRAEAGGSSISTAMIKMSQAVSEGGAKLEGFASVAGMSADEFAYAFRDNAALAIEKFVGGLKKIDDASDRTFASVKQLHEGGMEVEDAFDKVGEGGTNVFNVLKDLELGDIRVRNSLLALANSEGILTDTLKWGEEAWNKNIAGMRDGSALAQEAGIRYATLESQVAIAQNRLNDTAITLGNALRPAFIAAMNAASLLMGGITQLVNWFAQLPEPVRNGAAAFATVLAAAGPLIALFGMLAAVAGVLISPIGLVVVGVAALAAAFASNFGGIQGILTPIGAALTGLGTSILNVINQFGGMATIQVIVAGIQAALSGVGQAVLGVITSMSGMLSVQSVLMLIVGGLGMLGFSMMDVMRMASTIPAILGNAFGSVVSIFQLAGQSVGVFIAGLMQIGAQVAPILMTAFASVAVIVGAAFFSAIEVVRAIFGQLPSIISSVMQIATGIVSALAPVMMGAFAVAVPIIAGIFAALPGIVAGAMNIIAGTIKFVADHWQAFAVVLGVVGAIMSSGVILGAVAAISGALATVGTAISIVVGLFTGAVPVVLALGSAFPALGAAILFIASPIGIATALVAGLAVAFLTNFGGIRDWLMQALPIMGAAIQAWASEGAANFDAFAAKFGITKEVLAGIFAGIVALFALPLAPMIVLGAAVAALAVAWATNMGDIQGKTAQYIERVKANFDQLVGWFGAVKNFFASPIDWSNPIASIETMKAAWQGLQNNMSAVNANFDATMAGIGQSAATGADIVRDNYYKMPTAAEVATQLMNAVMSQNFGAIPGIVQGNMQVVEQVFGSHMAGIIMKAVDMATKVKSEVASVKADLASVPAFSGTLQDPESRRSGTTGSSAMNAASGVAASAQQATNTANNIRDGATNLGGAASGAGAAAKTAEQKIQEASQAIQAVAKVVEDLAKMLANGLDKFTVGDGADQIIQVAGQLASMGRRMVDAFVPAAAGLTEDSSKAAQALSGAISAVSSGLGTLIGFLPKMTEFLKSDSWAEIQDAPGMIEAAAAQLSTMGRSIADSFIGAGQGISEEAAATAQNFGTALSGAATGLGAMIDLLPKLWEFINLPEFDEMMAAQDLIANAAGQISQVGRAIFESFMGAAGDITAETSAAAQAASQGITAATGAVSSIIDVIVKLVDFLSDVSTASIIAYESSRRAVINAAAVITRIGVAMFENFAGAAEGISSKSVAGAKRLGEGITATVGAIGGTLDLIVKILDFMSDGYNQWLMASSQMRIWLTGVGVLIAQIGFLMFTEFSKAGETVTANSVSAAKRLSEGITATVGAVGSTIDVLIKMIDFMSDGYNQFLMGQSQMRVWLAGIGVLVMQIGNAILWAFIPAAVQLTKNGVDAAKRLSEGIGAVMGAVSGALDTVVKLAEFTADVGNVASIASDSARASLVWFGTTLVQIGAAINGALAPQAAQMSKESVEGTKQVAEAVGAVFGAISGAIDSVSKLADYISNDAVRASLLSDAAKNDIVFFGSTLLQLGGAIVGALAPTAIALAATTSSAIKTFTDAVTAVFGGVGAGMDMVVALLDFASKKILVAIVKSVGARAWFADLAVNILKLGDAIITAFMNSEIAIGQDAVNAITKAQQALEALLGALTAVTDILSMLFEYVKSPITLTSTMTQAVDTLGGYAVELANAWVTATAAFLLLSDPTTTLVGILTSTLNGLGSTISLLEMLNEWVKAPVTLSSTIRTAIDTLAGNAVTMATAFAGAAVGFNEVNTTGVDPLVTAVGAALSGLSTTIDILTMMSEWIKAPITLSASMRGSAAQLGRDAVSLATDFATAAVGFDQLTNDGIAALTTTIKAALDGLKATIDLLKMMTEFAKAPLISSAAMRTDVMFLATDAWMLAKIYADAAEGFDQVTNNGVAALTTAIKNTLDGLASTIELLKMMTEFAKAPLMSSQSMRIDVMYLATDAYMLASAWATAAEGFDQIANDGVAALTSTIKNALDGLKTVIDILKVMTEFAKAPLVYNDHMQLYVGRLITSAVALATAWAAAAKGFDLVTNAGVEPLATTVKAALDGLSATIEILRTMAEFAKAPLVYNDHMQLYVGRLIASAVSLATAWAAAAKGFDLVTNAGVAPLAAAVKSALDGLKATIDILTALHEYAKAPVQMSMMMAAYAWNLMLNAVSLATAWATAAKGFDLVTNEGVAPLATTIKTALDGLKAVIDILTALDAYMKAPVQMSMLMATYAWNLMLNAVSLATAWATAAKGFDLVTNAGVAPLAAAVKSALDGLKAVIDILQALDAYMKAPVQMTMLMGMTAWNLMLAAVSLATAWATAAKGFDLVTNAGVEPLASAIKTTLDGIKSVIDIITALGKVAADDLEMPEDWRTLANNLITYAKELSTIFVAAASGFTTNDGVEALGKAAGTAFKVIKDALDIFPQMNSQLAGYVGMSDGVRENLKTIVKDAVKVFQDFASVAISAEISDAALEAGDNLSKGFGSAMSTLKGVFDMIKMMSEGLPTLSFKMVSPDQLSAMLEPYFDFADGVWEAFKTHATGRDPADIATVDAFSKSVGTLFDTLKKVFDGITAFQGMNLQSANTGSSGIGNIKSVLTTVFATFGEFAPQAAGVTATAAALTAAVNAISNLASTVKELTNGSIDATKIQALLDAFKLLLSPTSLQVPTLGIAIGMSLGDGIATGLTAKKDAIVAAFGDIIDAINDVEIDYSGHIGKPKDGSGAWKPEDGRADNKSGSGSHTVNNYSMVVYTDNKGAAAVSDNFEKLKALKGSGDV